MRAWPPLGVGLLWPPLGACGAWPPLEEEGGRGLWGGLRLTSPGKGGGRPVQGQGQQAAAAAAVC